MVKMRLSPRRELNFGFLQDSVKWIHEDEQTCEVEALVSATVAAGRTIDLKFSRPTSAKVWYV